eukprot:TRINITY_DN3525_c1_g3_i1.p1 TRINITY_DN3525_c1_g3~~TRINITY_DN3525_c1_g3_i1.p1  ORF type:complete len:514 (+),score=78.55 TRINITY_DN3525_c1_g3_i1:101-1543(+)
MEGVMMLLNSLKGNKEVDWRGVAEGCGLVGDSNSEVDDMVWFVVRKASRLGGSVKEEAVVRRRTEKETWLSEDENVHWEKTFYLNLITNWKYTITVAIINQSTSVASNWVTREIFASPQRVKDHLNGKELTYEDTYPDIYFNIEDFEAAFGDMRLCYGQAWAVEISALSPVGRVQIVKGKLSYQQIARKFQSQAGGNRVDHLEQIVVKGPGGEGTLVLSVSVAPEEEVGTDVDIEKSKNSFSRLARRTRQRIEGRHDRVSQATTPALQITLPCLFSNQQSVVSSILQLEKTPCEEWIRLPAERSSDSGTSSPSRVEPVELTEEQYKTLFLAQKLSLSSPRDQQNKKVWYEAFFNSLLYVDAVIGCVWSGWVSKRAGKRIFGQQAYKQRMIVITAPGFLHYFSDATPNSEVKGTCYLRSARLVRRLRSSSSSPTPFVLEIHPCTPRRPQSTMDPAFHFGFTTDAELRAFIDQISRFCLMEP